MDGPNILNLNFNTVLTAVKQLKKSCKAWVQESKPRKLLKNWNYLYHCNPILDTDDHQNALCAQTAIEEVYDNLTAQHAQYMSKRSLVELLVSILKR